MFEQSLQQGFPGRHLTLAGAAATLGARAWFWYQRARQREHLAALAPEMLRDIGVEHEAAQREARKPFWQD